MSKRFTNGRVDPKRMTCAPCLKGECNRCLDTILIAAYLEPMCTCTRRGHDGEPVNKQIQDPGTGVVYAPGLAVTQEGEVVK